MDYSWQAPLGAVLVESDLEKLPALVFAAEKAIVSRAQELAKSNNGRAESDALQAAVYQLLVIKTERLKWPRIVSDGAAHD
jgi:hypothetical protein